MSQVPVKSNIDEDLLISATVFDEEGAEPKETEIVNIETGANTVKKDLWDRVKDNPIVQELRSGENPDIIGPNN